MPEHEFEIYLDLLARLLRLKPEQRSEIADELRDHLQTRLDELTAAGVHREKAVRRALAEFGDAAGLASDFTDIARKRTRRFIMRCTVGTVAVVACGMLLLSAFWPAGAPHAPQQAVAQDEGIAAGASDRPPGAAAPRDDALPGRRDPTVARVETKLDQPLAEVQFVDQPLLEFVSYVEDAIQVDILLNKKSFEDVAIPLDTTVTLQVQHTQVSARTVLELMLEQISDGEIHYIIRDGLIYLTSAEDDSHIEVYNVRDLLGDASKWQPAVKQQPSDEQHHQHHDHAAPAGGGEAPADATARLSVPVHTAQFAGNGGGGFGGGGFGEGGFFGGDYPPREPTPADNLIAVIQNSVNVSPWMDLDGDGGTVTEFGGLLVIRTSQKAHREIKDLLEMMRSAAGEEKPGTSGRPLGRLGGGLRFNPTPLLAEPPVRKQ